MRVAAVDLGATSGRVAVVDLDTFELTVAHRFVVGQAPDDTGVIRWQFDRLVADVEVGLRTAIAAGPIASVGVDAWGVDYGLVGADGRLVAAPVSYRDARTHGWEQRIATIGRERVYAITGIQHMAINTLNQLRVHDRAELDRAQRLLMMPDLVSWRLAGGQGADRTSAGTSQLVDVATETWSPELLDAVGVDASVMPSIGPVGAERGRFEGVRVLAVGGHDTASAVVALPDPAPGSAFVSSGTWSLVGAERPVADTSQAAAAANFSNEPAVYGGYRFLRNVMGLWMLEECRRTWGMPAVTDLVAAAEQAGPSKAIVDATDERFLAPDDMEAEVRAAAAIPDAAGRGVVARCVLDSLAVATARVVDDLERLSGAPVARIHVIGGGSQNTLLNRLTAEASGRDVVAGPVEATALGNAMAQGIALGRFAGLDEARTALARTL